MDDEPAGSASRRENRDDALYAESNPTVYAGCMKEDVRRRSLPEVATTRRTGAYFPTLSEISASRLSVRASFALIFCHQPEWGGAVLLMRYESRFTNTL